MLTIDRDIPTRKICIWKGNWHDYTCKFSLILNENKKFEQHTKRNIIYKSIVLKFWRGKISLIYVSKCMWEIFYHLSIIVNEYVI